MKLSFLMPTNRPSSGIARTIKNVCEVWKAFDLELLVCSQNEIDDPKIRWTKDTFGGMGSVSPINAMARQATGDYLIVANDDIQFAPAATKVVDFLESSAFDGKKFKLAPIPVAWVARVKHWVDGGLDIPVCHYPVISRHTVTNMLGGYFFHPGFKHHCVDHWLSYYVQANGEPLVSLPNVGVCITDTRWQQRTDHDRYDYRLLEILIGSYKVEFPYYF